MGNLLSALGLSSTNADGSTGVGVNVNVTIAQSSLISLFVVGVGLIVIGAGAFIVTRILTK